MRGSQALEGPGGSLRWCADHLWQGSFTRALPRRVKCGTGEERWREGGSSCEIRCDSVTGEAWTRDTGHRARDTGHGTRSTGLHRLCFPPAVAGLQISILDARAETERKAVKHPLSGAFKNAPEADQTPSSGHQWGLLSSGRPGQEARLAIAEAAKGRGVRSPDSQPRPSARRGHAHLWRDVPCSAPAPCVPRTRSGRARGRALTNRLCTSSFTFAAVSVDCLPDEASFMSVDRKFLHFFTFSMVSWIQVKRVQVKER